MKYKMIISSFGSPSRLISSPTSYGIPTKEELWQIDGAILQINETMRTYVANMTDADKKMAMAPLMEQIELIQWLKGL